MPQAPMHLDGAAGHEPLVGGLGAHARQPAPAGSRRGLPDLDLAGILSPNRLGSFGHRWCTRVLFCRAARPRWRAMPGLRGQWLAKRNKIAAPPRETAFQQESPPAYPHAVNKAQDADVRLGTWWRSGGISATPAAMVAGA